MIEFDTENLSWRTAALHLKTGLADVVSSDDWTFAGKYFFAVSGVARDPLTKREVGDVYELWYRDAKGDYYEWEPSPAGKARSDWRHGPSRGKQVE